MTERTLIPPRKDFQQPTITAEVYTPRAYPWERIAPNIHTLTLAAFSDYRDPQLKDDLKEYFQNPNNTQVLLLFQEDIVGYTVAIPMKPLSDKDTAYVTATAIHPDWQKKGHWKS